MNIGHIAGGTHAGWKIQKPAPKPWTHHCRREMTADEIADQEERREFIGRWVRYPRPMPAYMSRCNDCGTKRPEHG